MTPADDIDRLRTLIAARKKLIALDEGWAGYTEAQRQAAFQNLEAIQDDLLKSNFCKPEAKLLSLAVLLDGSDCPNFADDFKNSLFEILRRSDR